MKRLTLPVNATWTYNALMVEVAQFPVCRLYVQVDTVSPVRGSKLGAAQLALARNILFGTVFRGRSVVKRSIVTRVRFIVLSPEIT